MFELAVFSSDITPPLGHPLCAGWYPPATGVGERLSALGVILVGDGQAPVVLCALDWAELSNHEHRRWREALGAAAGAAPDHVAVHCTHAHDTPWPDREAQALLDRHGDENVIMAGDWGERVREAVAAAVADAAARLEPCTHIATGEAAVSNVASNRRIMGDDGKVKVVRWTQTKDPAVRAAPVGCIDPMLKTVAFYHGDRRLACLHFYAVHPTSYDGTGLVTPEFVGLARNRRTAADGVPHIYFTGCGGNTTAGKYNDGNPANRPVLTQRIYEAMVVSEQAMDRRRLERFAWRVAPICLPPREDLDDAALHAVMADPAATAADKSRAALMLTYKQRWRQPIPITCLHINADVAVVGLPGETFVEYQLLAQELRPDAFVAVAGYGDLGPGYITLAKSFAEGGYEPTDSFVSGNAEAIMRRAIADVLDAP